MTWSSARGRRPQIGRAKSCGSRSSWPTPGSKARRPRTRRAKTSRASPRSRRVGAVRKFEQAKKIARKIDERMKFLRDVARSLNDESGGAHKHRLHAGEAVLSKIDDLIDE